MGRVLNTPPPTWAKYLKAEDYWGIVNMEFTEARSAIKNFNHDPGKIGDAKKELAHAAAALLMMREHLDEQVKDSK